MPLTLLEVGGGILGLGIVGYIATRKTSTGTGVVFSSPNPTAVAAITSSNANNYASLQSAITARSQIGASLALGLAQLDTTNRANALSASTADRTTAANLTSSLAAQATSYKIAANTNASTNYGVALTASKDVKLATIAGTAADYQANVAATSQQNIAQLAKETALGVAASTNAANVKVAQSTNAAAVQLGKAQATASVGIAQAQGAAQASVAASQSTAQQVAAVQQQQATTNAANAASSAQQSSAMWGGLGSIAGSIGKIVPFSSGGATPSYLTDAANYGTLPGGLAAG